MDNLQLKALGLAFKDNQALSAAYGKAKVQLLLPIYGMEGLGLDLNSLPTKPFSFKEVFLQWALLANKDRIIGGREPLFTLGLVQACPLWKLIPPPYITLKLDKESLLKTTGRSKKVIGTASGGAINRSNRNNR